MDLGTIQGPGMGTGTGTGTGTDQGTGPETVTGTGSDLVTGGWYSERRNQKNSPWQAAQLRRTQSERSFNGR
ncbi:MAG: hypothetical protein ACREVK_10960 [Gammaproteobacteria bacterium]